MPSLLPIILTASQIVLAADQVPKFDVERTCRPAATVGLPGRDAAACQRDENEARAKVEELWTQYKQAQRSECVGFVGLDRAPSYVELQTCLEIAKDFAELREASKSGTVGSR